MIGIILKQTYRWYILRMKRDKCDICFIFYWALNRAIISTISYVIRKYEAVLTTYEIDFRT